MNLTMADPKDEISTQDILAQYGPTPQAKPKDEHGFLFSNIGGELKFNPWEHIKGFMGYRAPPGALSTSGDDQPIRDAFDTAGWVGLPGLGLNYAGALPANSVGIFGGRLGAANLAKQGIHAPEKAIQMAERMKAEGATPAEIWQATTRLMEREDPRFSGVHFGKEGAPQFEIPDYQAKWPSRMQDEWEMRNFMESRPGETLEHPLLHAAYPEIKGVPMSATARARFQHEGRFDPGTFPGDIRDARFTASGPTPESARSAALHELDHGAAFIEGHARGSSPERAAYVVDPTDHEMRNILAEREFLSKQFEKSVPGEDPHYRSRKADLDYANQTLDARAKELGYKRSAGETRARNVQARRNMTPEELRARPPWETQDVPDAQQILQMYENGPQRMASDPRASTMRLDERLQSLNEDQLLAVARKVKSKIPDGADADTVRRYIHQEVLRQVHAAAKGLSAKTASPIPGMGREQRPGELAATNLSSRAKAEAQVNAAIDDILKQYGDGE